MTRQLVTCGPDDRLDRAVRLMWDRDIGCVLVTDPEGKLAGVITDRDACMAAYHQGLPLSQILVSSAMARELWTCTPAAATRVVEKIMSVHQIRRVPVVDPDGSLVGIVTLNDLARAARCSPDAAINQREVEATLAAISKPRPVA